MELELQIVVNNAKNSVHRVIFISPHDLGAFMTGDEIKEANHWHNLLTHIIDRTDGNIISENSSSTYVADELTKLADLYSKGILTEEEFKQQKQRMLN
ncbi:SHOCT domain-containing protein [Bacillus sp. FJAT-29790]|nr:SHOCT domain-containing protein [Bacillus sp. FJAT-29790]